MEQLHVTVCRTQLFSSILVWLKCTRYRGFHRYILSIPQVMKPTCFWYTINLQIDGIVCLYLLHNLNFQDFCRCSGTLYRTGCQREHIYLFDQRCEKERQEGMRSSPFQFLTLSLPAQLPSGHMELASHLPYFPRGHHTSPRSCQGGGQYLHTIRTSCNESAALKQQPSRARWLWYQTQCPRIFIKS